MCESERERERERERALKYKQESWNIKGVLFKLFLCRPVNKR